MACHPIISLRPAEVRFSIHIDFRGAGSSPQEVLRVLRDPLASCTRSKGWPWFSPAYTATGPIDRILYHDYTTAPSHRHSPMLNSHSPPAVYKEGLDDRQHLNTILNSHHQTVTFTTTTFPPSIAHFLSAPSHQRICSSPSSPCSASAPLQSLHQLPSLNQLLSLRSRELSFLAATVTNSAARRAAIRSAPLATVSSLKRRLDTQSTDSCTAQQSCPEDKPDSYSSCSENTQLGLVNVSYMPMCRTMALQHC